MRLWLEMIFDGLKYPTVAMIVGVEAVLKIRRLKLVQEVDKPATDGGDCFFQNPIVIFCPAPDVGFAPGAPRKWLEQRIVTQGRANKSYVGAKLFGLGD